MRPLLRTSAALAAAALVAAAAGVAEWDLDGGPLGAVRAAHAEVWSDAYDNGVRVLVIISTYDHALGDASFCDLRPDAGEFACTFDLSSKNRITIQAHNPHSNAFSNCPGGGATVTHPVNPSFTRCVPPGFAGMLDDWKLDSLNLGTSTHLVQKHAEFTARIATVEPHLARENSDMHAKFVDGYVDLAYDGSGPTVTGPKTSGGADLTGEVVFSVCFEATGWDGGPYELYRAAKHLELYGIEERCYYNPFDGTNGTLGGIPDFFRWAYGAPPPSDAAVPAGLLDRIRAHPAVPDGDWRHAHWTEDNRERAILALERGEGGMKCAESMGYQSYKSEGGRLWQEVSPVLCHIEKYQIYRHEHAPLPPIVTREVTRAAVAEMPFCNFVGRNACVGLGISVFSESASVRVDPNAIRLSERGDFCPPNGLVFAIPHNGTSVCVQKGDGVAYRTPEEYFYTGTHDPGGDPVAYDIRVYRVDASLAFRDSDAHLGDAYLADTFAFTNDDGTISKPARSDPVSHMCLEAVSWGDGTQEQRRQAAHERITSFGFQPGCIYNPFDGSNFNLDDRLRSQMSVRWAHEAPLPSAGHGGEGDEPPRLTSQQQQLLERQQQERQSQRQQLLDMAVSQAASTPQQPPQDPPPQQDPPPPTQQSQQQPPPPQQDPPPPPPPPPQQDATPANLVSGGSFEDPAVTGHGGTWQMFANGTAGLGWAVENGPLELQRGILGGASDGAQHAELDGRGSATISQVLDTEPGATYAVSFDYKARPDTPRHSNGLQATWNGADIAPGIVLGGDWQTFTVRVLGTGSDVIAFSDTGTSDGVGTFLDGVSVALVDGPPPPPQEPPLQEPQQPPQEPPLQEPQQPPQQPPPPPQEPPLQEPQQIPVNLISNGSFEAPIVTAHNGQWQQFAPSTAGMSWTVTGDSLELQRGILGGASDGSQHAELDARGSVTISQTLNTVSGQAYEISFDYKARPNTASNTNGMNVTWNGVDIAPNLTFGSTWQTYAVNATGTGSDTISFADTGTSDGLGTFLDNVSVVGAVPP